MRVNINLRNEWYIPISEAREQRIQEALRRADYSTNEGVNRARDKITYMGLFDTLLDDWFHGGSKQEALKAFADLFLCEQASKWHSEGESTGQDRRLADSVNEESRLRSHASFFELVRQEALQEMVHAHEDVGTGIRFAPQTSSSEVNALLDVVLPYEHAATLFAKAGMLRYAATAYECAANHRSSAIGRLGDISLVDMVLAARAREHIRFHPQAAHAWDAVGDHERAAKAWEMTARCQESLGGYGGDEWEMAAAAWHKQARVWHAARRHEDAQVAITQEAKAYANKGEYQRAAQVWRKNAVDYEAAGRHDMAAEALAHAVLCFEAMGEHAQAVEVRGKALAALAACMPADGDSPLEERYSMLEEQARSSFDVRI